MITSPTVDGIDIHIDGVGPHSIVMIHGWPDTHRLWDATVQVLKATHRCIRFSLPGYDIAQPRRPQSVAQLVEFFRHVVEQTCPGQRVTLLLHDWGAAFGYQFAMAHPQLVARVIGVDVGDTKSAQHMKSLDFKAKLGIAAYQLWLMLAWRVGSVNIGAIGVSLGDRMTRWMAGALRCTADPRLIGCAMNYPYDMAWTGSHGGLKLKPLALDCPMLFIYGQRKPFMFHSQAWADALAAQPGCKVVGLRTGHWVMVGDPAGFHAALRDWLDAPAAVG